ncbi:MAG: sigma-54-dependent Fis family transcriptional regulator [Calditrichaeota bacterium]|nr:MAG: sigma-54-dependent Fis family transcriptional regulator [Calditrichota bacterium]
MENLVIFVVDDEKNIRRAFELILQSEPGTVESFATGEDCLQRLAEITPDVVFLDVLLPGKDGLTLLTEIKQRSPSTEVVMISGHATLSMAVQATRAGAYDFLEKPLQKEKILLTLRHLQERRALQARFSQLQQSLGEEYRMVGRSKALQQVLQQVARVAPTDSKVLITGESGVGKELVAFAIHQASPRAQGPFVKMNCAAIPEELAEAELFGSEKGAYTGASQRREGKFMQAHRGTLFLDEIGDMSLTTQAKVLRVLQDGEFQRVGGHTVLRSDVRIIAATNQDLEAMVRQGTFREDLYYRLNVVPIHLPPLRERPEDIPLLVEHFVQRFCSRNNRRTPVIEPTVLEALKHYAWPGNVRELQNLVERLLILARGNRIGLEDLPAHVLSPHQAAQAIPPGSKTLSQVREEAERAYLLRCLQATGWNVARTARLVGLERTNLHKRMKALGISRPEPSTKRETPTKN